MPEVIKYQLALTINGNGKAKVFFNGANPKVFTVPGPSLASLDAVLKQPSVWYDPATDTFIGQDQFTINELKPF